jgi:hypothetical protein
VTANLRRLVLGLWVVRRLLPGHATATQHSSVSCNQVRRASFAKEFRPRGSSAAAESVEARLGAQEVERLREAMADLRNVVEAELGAVTD